MPSHLTGETARLRISQSTARRAADRFARGEVADADLTLEDIEQDEATRVPARARKMRRLARARRVKAERRFARMHAKQLIEARMNPRPSRGAIRMAERLDRQALEAAK